MENHSSETVSFVDTHFHFDLYKGSAQLLGEIEDSDVTTIAVTNAPSVFHHTLRISKTNRRLLPAVGLHPELVATHGHELNSMWPMLDQTRFVGEIGLDYVTSDLENRRAQKEAFSRIIEKCAAYGDKVLSVHSRRSASDVISVIGDRFPGSVILHWFSGTRRELERAIEFGFYFSIGPAMVKSKNGLALLSVMPRDRVLTETDGPFVQTDGRPARPSDTASVVREISQLWEQHASVTKSTISHNFDSLLKCGSLRPDYG